jgi:phosphatidylinositol alpha 1,6-mannosyltransferase
MGVRIAYVTESFPPDVNGVAHTAMRVAEQLASRGHEPLIIAPEPARGADRPDRKLDYPVVRVPSLALPLYRGFRVGLPGLKVSAAIANHRTDLVHLSGPVVIGASGRHAAGRQGLPSVAVYATDMAAYARAYFHAGSAGEKLAWRYMRHIHNGATRTLAPSSATASELQARGFERVFLWGRGVDTSRFDPDKRSQPLRARLAPGGEVIVGYVGRLAAEKRLDLLAQVGDLPGVKLVIVGDGPAAQIVRRALPTAEFLGQREGEDLARLYASFDIFVHSGPHETFGNTLQEAAASGLPIVAPAAGGPVDLVEDGATGFLVTPGDGQAIADAVSRLVHDADLRTVQGMAARCSMLNRGWPARCEELIGHYDAVLGQAMAVPMAEEAEARAA